MSTKCKWAIAIAGAVLAVLSAVVCAVSKITQSRPVSLNPEGIQATAFAEDEARIYLGTRDNRILATDRSGQLLWEFGGINNAPVRLIPSGSEPVIYTAAGNAVIVLAAETGELLSVIDGYTDSEQRKIYFPNLSDLALRADGERLLISAGSSKSKHYLYECDTSGNLIGSVALGITAETVAYRGNDAIAGTVSGKVLTFREGRQIAEYRAAAEVRAVAVGNGSTFALTAAGELLALDEGLAEIAVRQVGGEGSALAYSDGLIFAGTREGTLAAYDEALNSLSSKNVGSAVREIGGVDGEVAWLSSNGYASVSREDFLGDGLKSTLFTVFLIAAIAFAIVSALFVLLAVPGARHALGRFGRALVRHRAAYLMLLPIFALLAVFSFYPVLIAAVRAFTDWNGNSSVINFVGFENFVTMVREGYFLVGIKNLCIFLLSYMIKILTVPLLIATFVYHLRSDRAKYWFRFLFVLPMVVPGVVTVLMWKNIYDPNYGLLNELLRALNLGQYATSWLSNEKTAIWALIFVGFPFADAFSFLIYYSAMVNIPSSVIEANKLDGAGPFRTFFSMIVPLIAPQIKILIMLGFINQIQDFNVILLMTQGAPGTSTYVPGYELYLNATKFGRYGYACALGMVLFVAILIGTLILNRVKVNQDLTD